MDSADVLMRKWYVYQDDAGNWFVLSDGPSESYSGEQRKELAQHIVQLHNEWVDRQWPKTWYQDIIRRFSK